MSMDHFRVTIETTNGAHVESTARSADDLHGALGAALEAHGDLIDQDVIGTLAATIVMINAGLELNANDTARVDVVLAAQAMMRAAQGKRGAQ